MWKSWRKYVQGGIDAAEGYVNGAGRLSRASGSIRRAVSVSRGSFSGS